MSFKHLPTDVVCTRRFVDRDMLMRYLGGGPGHLMLHGVIDFNTSVRQILRKELLKSFFGQEYTVDEEDEEDEGDDEDLEMGDALFDPNDLDQYEDEEDESEGTDDEQRYDSSIAEDDWEVDDDQ